MAVTKVINSESKQYKPVLVDSLVLDAAPTVGSLNGVTSDGVAKAISGSGSVPTPTADDDGKVLTANDGSFEWADPTGGASYTAGTGITISEENAIAVTEAISSGAAAGATAVQPAALNDYALSSSLATVATSGSYADLSNKPTIPTVDQNYNASSTNAQSGVAVAQAIAAIPSEVSTASGHFDLEGSVPVTVNYTGTPHVVSDYITLTNPTPTMLGTSLCIVFSTQGNKSLGADTANLVVNDTIHAKLLGVNYASDSWPSPGPEITTSTGSITSGTIEAQTIVLSGSNPATSSFGNSVLIQFSDLTDGETAESLMTKVSIQHWPAQTVDGYETTIPVVDQNYHSESANAQSGVAVAQAIAGISVDEVPDVGSTDDGKVLTASYSGGVGSYSWETAQGGGGGASYTAAAPIAIESDVIKLKRNNDFTMALPFDTVSTSPESTYQWAVQTQINLPGSASLGSTKLCVIVGNESSNDLYINASGSTGWTVIAYKPSDATTLYTYANESYEYVKTSGSWNYIAGRNSGKPMDSQQYYTFTFPAGASVGITGNLCFAIVPKASDGLTGSSPWNTPYADAYMFTSGGYLSTESNGYIYSVPTGSGDVSSISVLGLSNSQKLPAHTNADSGKVLQVQNNGTLAWVTLS